MNKDFTSTKAFRMIDMYERLNRGEKINKNQLVDDYNVTPKTVQRDLDDLRAYLSENCGYENGAEIIYNKSENSYSLVRQNREWLTNEDVLCVCKILLESRGLCKSELNSTIDKLLMQVPLKDKPLVQEIILSERKNYIQPQHKKKLLPTIWNISKIIHAKQILEIHYTRKDGLTSVRQVQPLAIMFSEFYFYLVANDINPPKDFPTIFRIDRITNFTNTKIKFDIPHSKIFSDGVFRKQVQFMFSGPLHTVEFEYYGPSLEAVLDRLPTAEIISSVDNVHTVKVEVYGNGIYMWLRSQGDYVKVIS